jgi:hypothetical protein
LFYLFIELKFLSAIKCFGTKKLKLTQPFAEILHEAEELWERQSSETSSEVGSASTGSSDIGDMTPPRKPAHQHHHRIPPKVCVDMMKIFLKRKILSHTI